jgi:CheY-like chemotaxis protein
MREKYKILVVDDDFINNIITEEIIKNTGLSEEIHIATNGQEAIDFIKEHCMTVDTSTCIDLILLDLNMPIMDGFEFLEKVQNYPLQQTVKIVVLTTSTDNRDVDKANKYPIAGFLSKPLTIEKFNQLHEKLSNS